MKKTILFALFGGILGATSVMAANYDLYITGSTAFRSQAFAACQALYDGGNYSSANNGTVNAISSSDSRWTMTGTAANLGITSGSDTLTIHALWTGSVQGLSALKNKDQLVFLASATPQDTTLKTNTASACLSDVFSAPTLDPLPSASFFEQPVAVQPFIFVKSLASGGVQSVTNITWQQLNTFLGSSGGSVPLSYLTGKPGDYSTNIYMVHRTKDSGTRVTAVQEAKKIGTISVNYYDPTSDSYIPATTNRGPAQFGPGYVGGGDVKAVMQTNTIGNQAIAYLSYSDAKTISSPNWSQMLSYNGEYPIANYTPGSTIATNDFTPICTGKYSFWAFEMLDWPQSSQYSTYTDQNIGYTRLNNVMTTLSATGPGAGPTGSFDNQIYLSETTGSKLAVAVRLGEVSVSRNAVGGTISP